MKKFDAPLLVGVKILGPVSVFGGPSLQYIIDSAVLTKVENRMTIYHTFLIYLHLNQRLNQ